MKKQKDDIIKCLNVVKDRTTYYSNKGATSKAQEKTDFAIFNELLLIEKRIISLLPTV